MVKTIIQIYKLAVILLRFRLT